MLVREVVTDLEGNVTERWVEMPDVVTPEAQAAVDVPRAAQAAALATNEQSIGQQAAQAMDALRQVRDGGALSATQQTAFNKLTAKVMLLLVRIALKRFDAQT